MRPVGKPMMSKNDAEKFFSSVKKIPKNYVRNVVGGAKIVGSAIKNKLK